MLLQVRAHNFRHPGSREARIRDPVRTAEVPGNLQLVTLRLDSGFDCVDPE